MATNFEGMFIDPNSYRDERLNQLMQDRMAISGMGGSMNQLLGQVAAGGGATGAMMAEGLGGMLGMQTREEAQAAQLQDMASQIDMNDPASLAGFAKRLNDLGLTKEAVMVMEKRQSVLDQANRDTDRTRAEEDRQRRIAKGEIRERRETVMVEKLDSKGKPTGVMEPKTTYYTEVWNEQKKKWERESNAPMQSQTQGGYVLSEGGGARVPQGTNVAPPQTKYQTKQNEQDATVDPWSTFTRY